MPLNLITSFCWCPVSLQQAWFLVTVEDSTAQEPMDELTVEPDEEEPKRKRKRRQKRAVHGLQPTG